MHNKEDHPTKEEWALRLKNDPEGTISHLFRDYYPYLYRSAYRVIPDSKIAEDLVQDVFYELWRKRDHLKINISINAYLKRAVVNKALNYIRDQKIKPEGEEGLVKINDTQLNPLQVVELSELEQRIHQAIKALPERCRLVFSLSRFEEMTYQEIADQLGVSIKTVEHQISKALKLLRQVIDKSATNLLILGVFHLFSLLL